ncbi:MAG TPA: serine/threonine protein phosphatase, partial [Alcanivorax sp.]|nr:serine/threonine protein phosphatase [Alcanivorax sp.]
MKKMPFSLAAGLLAATLAGCGGDSSSSDNTSGDGNGNNTPPATASTLKIGLLPDTQGGGDNVSMHPMKAVLDKEQ